MDGPLDDFFAGQVAGEVRIKGEKMPNRALAAKMPVRLTAGFAKLPPLARLDTVNNLSTLESGDSGITGNFNNHTGTPPLLYFVPSDKYIIHHPITGFKYYI